MIETLFDISRDVTSKVVPVIVFGGLLTGMAKCHFPDAQDAAILGIVASIFGLLDSMATYKR